LHDVSGLIDAHQHYWQVDRSFPLEPHTWLLGAVRYPWREAGLDALDRSFLPSELEPSLHANGVEHTVLVNVLHSAAETEWMLALAQRTSSIAGVVGWLNVARPVELVAADLGALQQHPSFVGVRHLAQFETDSRWLLRDDVVRGLELLSQAGIPYDLLVTPRELNTVPELSERLPDLRMVVDHVAKPAIRSGETEPWASQIRRAAENPKLHCKLSGLVTEADHTSWRPNDVLPYVEEAVESFGIDRLMFGSDWPVCQLAASYERVHDLLAELLTTVLGEMTATVRQQIFAENARSFYGLSV
jgi:L-fuconolactonase